MTRTLDLIAPKARCTFADSDQAVYAPVPCPSCGYELEWAVVTPPIPKTFFPWYDPNGEGRNVEFCPRCDEELTDGDLTGRVA